MNKNIKNELELIFKKVFKDDTITINESTVANDIDRWDSLTNMILIVEIETHFNIEFAFHEVRRFENVGDLIIGIKTKIPQ